MDGSRFADGLAISDCPIDAPEFALAAAWRGVLSHSIACSHRKVPEKCLGKVNG